MMDREEHLGSTFDINHMQKVYENLAEQSYLETEDNEVGMMDGPTNNLN